MNEKLDSKLTMDFLETVRVAHKNNMEIQDGILKHYKKVFENSTEAEQNRFVVTLKEQAPYFDINRFLFDI